MKLNLTRFKIRRICFLLSNAITIPLPDLNLSKLKIQNKNKKLYKILK